MNYTGVAKLSFYRGRVALSAILKALDIGGGDHVAIQAFTCLAVPEGVLATGAKPRYVDIESDGYNMDPNDLMAKITSQTRVIVVQHTFGIPARMDRIMEIAERAGLPVIEDCCHTLKSTYHGRLLGTYGVASFYSYEWGKPIVVGLGGSALVNDDSLRQRVDEAYPEYRNPSMLRRLKLELQYRAFGLLYWPRLFWPVRTMFHTLSKLGAAEGNFNPVTAEGEVAEDFSLRMAPHLRRRLLRKLRQVDEHARHSQLLTAQYRSQIATPTVRHPEPSPGSETVYARYPLRVQDKPGMLVRARQRNVEMAEWYRTPVHPVSPEQLHLVDYEPGSCPNAETRASEIVSLPTHGRVGQRYLNRIVDFLNGVPQ